MRQDTGTIGGIDIPVYSLNTVVVGTGAAGYNAADALFSLGQSDIAVVSEGVHTGTSRNTGSDKQTYYKLSMAGDVRDSVAEMARTLFDGGSMHGDTALVEAALSPRCFYKLVDLGVPFPHNRYGEYVGYKTDHDPRQRATSCGPLTSKRMTEVLQQRVAHNGTPVFDGYRVIAILTADDQPTGGRLSERSAVGLLAVRAGLRPGAAGAFALFNCTNVVYAVGGPAGIYKESVYPCGHTGGSGVALEAGARGANLTESQYGLASLKFRWDLSGTYQQVIPRYLSTDAEGGDQREFLMDHFNTPGQALDAVFMKGYQWPFDPRKIGTFGSSLVDLLVYNETHLKGRRVFLDFSRNPSHAGHGGEFDFSLLGPEAFEYLQRSGALFGTPLERLAKMNQPAIDIYLEHGIDLSREHLEMAVCAQHNNGGLAVNLWWESNIRHLFPVGEVAGTLGVYRPGGSALNSTQVGSTRAAQYIIANGRQEPPRAALFADLVEGQVRAKLELARTLAGNHAAAAGTSTISPMRGRYQARMSRAGAAIRSGVEVRAALEECRADIRTFAVSTSIADLHELPDAFTNLDILLTQLAYLSSIEEYIAQGGRSRGSYIVADGERGGPHPRLPDLVEPSLDDGAFSARVCETWLEAGSDGEWQPRNEWKPVRPIPQEDNWFEKVWNAFMHGTIVG